MEEKHQNDTHKEKKTRIRWPLSDIIVAIMMSLFLVVAIIGLILWAVWNYVIAGAILFFTGGIIGIILGTYFFLKYHC